MAFEHLQELAEAVTIYYRAWDSSPDTGDGPAADALSEALNHLLDKIEEDKRVSKKKVQVMAEFRMRWQDLQDHPAIWEEKYTSLEQAYATFSHTWIPPEPTQPKRCRPE